MIAVIGEGFKVFLVRDRVATRQAETVRAVSKEETNQEWKKQTTSS